MAKKKIGELIKEARTNAGLTQEQLAKQVEGVSASDISKAERGEKALTQDALKQIAKATGVTQKSLLEAASGGSTAKKTSGSGAGRKTTTTTSAAGKKTSASSGTSVKLTAAEKRFIELYRKADAETRKAAEAVLKGEAQEDNLLESLLGGAASLLSNLGK